MSAATKLHRIWLYLLEHSRDTDAIILLNRVIRFEEDRRRSCNAFMRADRKAGNEAAEHATGFYQLPGNPPDWWDIQAAGNFARKAASNAFAAHPELRVA